MRYAEVPLAMRSRRAAAAPARVVSLDALRGFNFIWILGADGALLALQEMSRGKAPWVGALGDFLGTQMTHVAWEGFHFYDFIFPLFIFITGVAIPLALPKLVEREGKAQAHLRVLRRALLLYALGILYYGGLNSQWDDIRFLGVLQRIAIVYLFAAVLFLNLNWRALAAVFAGLLAGYWALMTFVPVPGAGAGSFAPGANLANWIDARYLPGRLWDQTRDPEGLLSTLPAIATGIAGVLAGILLKRGGMTPQRKVYWLIGAGIVALAAGYLWALQFPIIKYLWTSTFVLVAAGYSAILLGAAYQVIDVWGVKRWATAFVWIGANAITLYFINGIIGFEPFARRFVGGDIARFFDAAVTPGTGTFVTHLVALAFVVMLAGYLYRRSIFLRV